MRILVCVKQVPEPERIVVHEAGGGLADLEGFAEFRMNRFDEFAVEEALRIRETLGGVCVEALSAGPPRVAEVIRRAMGMGADHGIHLKAAPERDGDPAAVSAWIAGYAQGKRHDLFLTGSQSEDGMHGMVGPMTAGLLELPCATQVIRVQLSGDRSQVTVEREIEGGAREILELRLPALLALQPGINRPRYPSLSNLLRANRQELETVEVAGRRAGEGPVARLGLELPQRHRSLQVLSGTSQEKAHRFLAFLREKAFIR